MSCMPTIGRRDLHLPICTTAIVPGPATVMTVHNLAYQGKFPHQMLDAFGLPPESFTIHGVEYYGMISFLKAGLQFADRITTVSPTYAIEIQGDEGGMGLGGLLRERSQVLSGILNGIDTSVWNPETDPHIAARFSAQRATVPCGEQSCPAAAAWP